MSSKFFGFFHTYVHTEHNSFRNHQNNSSKVSEWLIIYTLLTSVYFLKLVQYQSQLNREYNHLWLRGSVSLILNPFLSVLSISGFLKVIHAPKPQKRGVNQLPQKLTSSIAFFKSSRSGLPMNLLNTHMPWIICPNDENPVNQANQFRVFFTPNTNSSFIIWTYLL